MLVPRALIPEFKLLAVTQNCRICSPAIFAILQWIDILVPDKGQIDEGSSLNHALAQQITENTMNGHPHLSLLRLPGRQ